MIGKEDLVLLLQQVILIEQELEDGYRQLSEEVKDSTLKSTFSDLSRDKKRHVAAEKELLQLLS